jgi:hypothetical protein
LSFENDSLNALDAKESGARIKLESPASLNFSTNFAPSFGEVARNIRPVYPFFFKSSTTAIISCSGFSPLFVLIFHLYFGGVP